MSLLSAVVVPPFCERDAVVCLKRVGQKDLYAACYFNEGSKHFVIALFWERTDAQDYLFQLEDGPTPLFIKSIVDYESVVLLTAFLHRCSRQNNQDPEVLTLVPESSTILMCHFEFCSSTMPGKIALGF